MSYDVAVKYLREMAARYDERSENARKGGDMRPHFLWAERAKGVRDAVRYIENDNREWKD